MLQSNINSVFTVPKLLTCIIPDGMILSMRKKNASHEKKAAGAMRVRRYLLTGPVICAILFFRGNNGKEQPNPKDFAKKMTMNEAPEREKEHMNMLIKNENVVLRPIHGSVFLIDISDNYSGDKCSLYEINETGAFLWNALDKNGTVDALVDSLQNAIVDEVPRDVLLSDVTEYINDLMRKRFVLEVAANG